MDLGHDEHGHDEHAEHGHPDLVSEAPGGHGMAVIGSGAVYMSHLPMYMVPHNYQVLLRVRLTGGDGDPETTYRDDRGRHPEALLYTFDPDRFVLPDLLPGPDAAAPKRTSFGGRLVRNHFEQPPAHPDAPVTIADGVTVGVLDVVHAHRFDPAAPPSQALTYLLFGPPGERFLAHVIGGRPPDFDQLLSVDVAADEFGEAPTRSAIVVTVPGRTNAPAARLTTDDTGIRVLAHVDGGEVPLPLAAITELYFETNDLAEAM